MSTVNVLDGVELDAAGDLPNPSAGVAVDDRLAIEFQSVESGLFRIFVEAVTGAPNLELFLEAKYERPGAETYWKEIANTRMTINAPSVGDAFHAEIGKLGGPIQGVRVNGSVTLLDGSNKLTIDGQVDIASSVRVFPA